MEATSSTAIVPQTLDGKHDYKDWSVRVKTYLLSKDLWDVVEKTSDEPPEMEGPWGSKFKVWRKNNAEALHAIQLSCGPRPFPWIRDKTTAKAAWDTLEEQFNREERSDENLHECQAFVDAVKRGDWHEMTKYIKLHPDALELKDIWGTPLHNAVRFGHEQIVEELVQMMKVEDLETLDSYGWTALAIAARDNLKMVECMVTRNKKLLGIAVESIQMTPILIAALHDRWDIVRYLYFFTPIQDLMPDKGHYGSQLVCFCLYAKQFDIAWELLQHCPRLACTQGLQRSPLSTFACLPTLFPSGTSLKFWQWWIYNCIHIKTDHLFNDFRVNVQNQGNEQGNRRNSTGIHIKSDHFINDFRINVQNQGNEQGNRRNSTAFGLLQGLPSRLFGFLGINRIHKLKLVHVRSHQILNCMFDGIKQLNDKEMSDSFVYETIFEAVENGIVELVISLCKAKPELLLGENASGKNIFHHAVECRQEKVYSLINGVGKKDILTTLIDDSGNGMLHCAGMLSPLAKEKLDRIPGAALQMQRERQWYKEVESIVVQLSEDTTKNKAGMTPPKLFTNDHKKLHEKGEKWMKDTATSYTVVSTLIVTIMFAAAFTVPGGNNQETGFPIFLNKKLFMVFIVSDAISLFSSATSVLMFLGILTSRYAEDDFLKSLPTKMIIGLSALSISIATMMVAFSSALFIMLQDKPWITYPILLLAGVPVFLFIGMQFPLLVEIFKSTYGGGIFDRKVKRWI